MAARLVDRGRRLRANGGDFEGLIPRSSLPWDCG